MLPPTKLLAVLLLLTPALLPAQTSTDLTAVLQRLDRLEQENRTLLEEVRALRAEVKAGSATGPDVAVTAGVPPGAANTQPESGGGKLTVQEQVTIQEHRIDELAQAKVEAAQRFPIRLTGMALFNAFSNSRQNGGSDYPTVASSPGTRRPGATIRQSIIGLEFRGPETLWGGHVHGSLYMDFFSGTLPLSQTFRVRTGSIQIDWASRNVMVGMEKPIFNPREPSSLAQVGVSPLTGAGNLWLWIPQARFEQDLSFTRASGLRAQVGVVQTRETGPYVGSPVTGPVEASRPGFEGRFEAFYKLDDERRLEVAPGFHVSTTHAASLSVPSRVLSLDWFFNPVRRIEFTGAFYHGENVAHLGTGQIRQGFDIDQGRGEPVHSTGGWAQITIRAMPRLDFHLFSGQQDDRNADLIAGAIGKNLLFGANAFFRIAPNVLLGPEVSQVRTVYLGQGTRLNNHYDLALAYLF